jgi:hypothetical protein
MDTSSSPAIRYIKDQPPENSLELSTEAKFHLLEDAVEALDYNKILFDLIGNRTMPSTYRDMDQMLALGTSTLNHELSAVRLLLICSRSWQEGTDYFFLTAEKSWYWIRTDSDSLFAVGEYVSMFRLEPQTESLVAKDSREGDDIFCQLLRCLTSIVGEEYAARHAQAQRFRQESKRLRSWVLRLGDLQ